jgi:hypothetical protein
MINKIFFGIPLACLTLSSFAQPVITGASNWNIGVDYIKHQFEDENFMPGTNDPNATWDFSQIVSNVSRTEVYEDATTHAKYSSFPKSNAVEDIFSSAGEVRFFLLNDTVFSLLGKHHGSSTEEYNDPFEYIKFPITYGKVFNETFRGSHAALKFEYYGSNKIAGTGYGKLILPYGKIENCLKVTSTVSETIILNMDTTHRTTVLYNWYHPQFDVVLLSYSANSNYGYYIDKSLVGIDHPDFEYHEISVYPQPASNVLNINYDLSQSTDVRIRLSDIAGRTVQPELILNNQQTVKESIDISALQAGVYVVQMVLNNSQVLTKKVVIN